MRWSDDPAVDFAIHEARQEAELAKRPKCADCGEYIQDDCYYDIYGDVICQNCLDSNYRKFT